jgi:hypothetical protein
MSETRTQAKSSRPTIPTADLPRQLRTLAANIREWKRTGVDAVPSERDIQLIEQAANALETQ